MNNNKTSQSTSNDLYEIRLREEMNRISTSAYNNGIQITKLESSVGLEILRILLCYACQGQNIGK
jgi:hypothetical protein